MIDDIYADLDDFGVGQSLDELQEQNNALSTQIETLTKSFEKTNQELAELKKLNGNLQQNISKLFNTAKCEIERKNREIATLRTKVEELSKRTGPSNYKIPKRQHVEAPDVPSAKKPKLDDGDQKPNRKDNQGDNRGYQDNFRGGRYKKFDNKVQNRQHAKRYRRSRSNSRERRRRSPPRHKNRRNGSPDYDNDQRRNENDFRRNENDFRNDYRGNENNTDERRNENDYRRPENDFRRKENDNRSNEDKKRYDNQRGNENDVRSKENQPNNDRKSLVDNFKKREIERSDTDSVISVNSNSSEDSTNKNVNTDQVTQFSKKDIESMEIVDLEENLFTVKRALEKCTENYSDVEEGECSDNSPIKKYTPEHERKKLDRKTNSEPKKNFNFETEGMKTEKISNAEENAGEKIKWQLQKINNEPEKVNSDQEKRSNTIKIETQTEKTKSQHEKMDSHTEKTSYDTPKPNCDTQKVISRVEKPNTNAEKDCVAEKLKSWAEKTTCETSKVNSDAENRFGAAEKCIADVKPSPNDIKSVPPVQKSIERSRKRRVAISMTSKQKSKQNDLDISLTYGEKSIAIEINDSKSNNSNDNSNLNNVTVTNYVKSNANDENSAEKLRLEQKLDKEDKSKIFNYLFGDTTDISPNTSVNEDKNEMQKCVRKPTVIEIDSSSSSNTESATQNDQKMADIVNKMSKKQTSTELSSSEPNVSAKNHQKPAQKIEISASQHITNNDNSTESISRIISEITSRKEQKEIANSQVKEPISVALNLTHKPTILGQNIPEMDTNTSMDTPKSEVMADMSLSETTKENIPNLSVNTSLEGSSEKKKLGRRRRCVVITTKKTVNS